MMKKRKKSSNGNEEIAHSLYELGLSLAEGQAHKAGTSPQNQTEDSLYKLRQIRCNRGDDREY